MHVGEPIMPAAQVFLPVTHLALVDSVQAAWGMEKITRLFANLWHGGDISFVLMCPGDSTTRAGWSVRAADLESATELASDLLDVCRAIAPWLGVGGPTNISPWPDLPPLSHFFVRGPVARGTLLTRQSPAWNIATKARSPWAMVVELGALVERVSVDHDAESTGPATPGAPDEVSCRVRLHGSGRRRALMAALVSEDVSGPVTLIAEPTRTGDDAPSVDLPLTLVGHLLSSVQRIENAFDEFPALSADTLFQHLAAAPSPHLLVLGGTGQGKTTLMEHLADRASALGEAIFAVDVHDGAFGRQVRAQVAGHGTECVLVDLAPEAEPPATLLMTSPPPGIAPASWADALFEIIRGVLWADAPEEFFGPVGRRAIMLCLHALIRDPDGPLPLTDLPSLLDTRSARFRDDILRRIGDDDLARSFATEVLPMLSTKDPGNSAIWIISKFEPMIGNSAMRRLTTGWSDTVPIEALVASGASVSVLAPVGELGEAGSRIAVSVILHRMWMAIRRRHSVAPVHLLLDEWQRFPIPSIASLLSEGRKFGVKLRLANQNLAQVPEELRQSALANVGTIAAFRTGPADAQQLDGLFKSVTIRQLQTLRPHQLAVAGGEKDLVIMAPPPLRRP